MYNFCCFPSGIGHQNSNPRKLTQIIVSAQNPYYKVDLRDIYSHKIQNPYYKVDLRDIYSHKTKQAKGGAKTIDAHGRIETEEGEKPIRPVLGLEGEVC